ncbi:histidinol-phosphate transaminase [Oceanirhabdus sp. W0125-5]|uniref:histidinol-phosphate transaminase n=1 Tax=Oceanirhabdus sp. W0125-5 TaxID=2999116 RepID=UPI0022F32CF1|nr:histidinol-phosphate transaminase [Oceanirhabdus sp. W0125-5]WBW99298.1 histidinol-phosphate transaminase [Oceanirhabdus sp. W0125-5]
MALKVRKEILDLGVYKAGKPISEVKRELGLDDVIKLASNENPFGCSQKAKEALIGIVEESYMYPDAGNFQLKTNIAEELNVRPEQVFCSTGSDALIKVICNTFIEEGDESIMAEITFPRYEAAVKLMGGKCIKVPMKNNGLDIEEMVNSINEKTKIIWFCNPNNPTGTTFNKTEFNKVLSRIPDHILIVMDEAYIEYVTSDNFPDSLEYISDYPNMITLRTFSKAYGLASLRVGYGIASEELVGYFNRVIGPFDVNLYAQTAAALAIKDKEFLKMVYEKNKEGKEYLYSEFKNMGLEYAVSDANFVFVNVATDTVELFDKLLRRGVIIRPGHLLGTPEWIRVSIGTMEQNKRFIKELKDILK